MLAFQTPKFVLIIAEGRTGSGEAVVQSRLAAWSRVWHRHTRIDLMFLWSPSPCWGRRRDDHAANGPNMEGLSAVVQPQIFTG